MNISQKEIEEKIGRSLLESEYEYLDASNEHRSVEILRREYMSMLGMPNIYRKWCTLIEKPADQFNSCKRVVLLTGTNGTGKTCKASRHFEYLAYRYYSAYHRQPPFMWIDFQRMCDELKDYSNDTFSHQKELRRYIHYHTLLIDDVLPEEKFSETDVSNLTSIIKARFENDHGYTLLTTNRTLKELNDISHRLADRLLEAHIEEMNGDSFRIKSYKDKTKK